MRDTQVKRSSRVSVTSLPGSSVASYKQFAEQQQGAHGGLAEHAMGGDWVELFYDLFFAAALSAYTNRRELLLSRDTADLAMYFTILWWTWASQTMYDVRFARPGGGEQAMKFVQLILLIGYGVFQDELSMFAKSDVAHGGEHAVPGSVLVRRRNDPTTSAIAIAVVFILSRIQLGSQYLYITYARKRAGKSTKTTLIWHCLLPYISALLWLLSLTVISLPSDGVFVARTTLWVSGILIEAIGILFLRAYEHGGFEHTEIVERLGALTVVLLGEGIIKLVRYLRDIKTGIGFTYKSGFAITSSVISIYLLWAIYFDHLNPHVKIGKIKAYAFIYLHFLYHFSLVLFLEGATGLLLWTNIDSGIKLLLDSDTNFGQAAGVLEDLFDLKFDKNNTLSLGKLEFMYRIEDGQMLKVKDAAKGLHSANHDASAVRPEGTAKSLHKREMPDAHGPVLPKNFNPRAPENIPSKVGQVLTEHEYNYVFVNIFGRLASSYRVEPSHFYLEYVDSLVPSSTSAELAQHAYTLLAQQFRLAAKFVLIAGGVLLLLNVPLMRITGQHSTPNWSRWVPFGSRVSTGAMLVLFGGIADLQNYAVHKYDPMRQTVLGALMGSGTLVPMWTATALVVYILDLLTRRYFQFWPRRTIEYTNGEHGLSSDRERSDEKSELQSGFRDPFTDAPPVAPTKVSSARSSLHHRHAPVASPVPAYDNGLVPAALSGDAGGYYHDGGYEAPADLAAVQRTRDASSFYGPPGPMSNTVYGIASNQPLNRPSPGSTSSLASRSGRPTNGGSQASSSSRSVRTKTAAASTPAQSAAASRIARAAAESQTSANAQRAQGRPAWV